MVEDRSHLTERKNICTIMNNMLQKIDVSDAREKLSSIMDKVYFSGEKFLILRRGIPMAVISGIMEYEGKNKKDKIKKKAIKSPLFGIWRNIKGTNIEINRTLREKAWESRCYAG